MRGIIVRTRRWQHRPRADRSRLRRTNPTMLVLTDDDGGKTLNGLDVRRIGAFHWALRRLRSCWLRNFSSSGSHCTLSACDKESSYRCRADSPALCVSPFNFPDPRTVNCSVEGSVDPTRQLPRGGPRAVEVWPLSTSHGNSFLGFRIVQTPREVRCLAHRPPAARRCNVDESLPRVPDPRRPK